MMASFIKAISYYLPEITVSNEVLASEFPEWSVGKIAKKVGVNNRHVVTKDQCASDIAEQAVRRLLIENGIDKNCIDFLLFCTQSPDYFLPTTACLLQDRLGLGIRCGALDFNLGCSGFVYGLALAKGLIESDTAKNVLLVTAETYSRHIHKPHLLSLLSFRLSPRTKYSSGPKVLGSLAVPLSRMISRP